MLSLPEVFGTSVFLSTHLFQLSNALFSSSVGGGTGKLSKFSEVLSSPVTSMRGGSPTTDVTSVASTETVSPSDASLATIETVMAATATTGGGGGSGPTWRKDCDETLVVGWTIHVRD